MAGIIEWNYKNIDREKIIDLAIKCNIPFVSAAIMYARGITSKESVFTFLKDSYEPNPKSLFEIPDMDKAVSRLKRAIKDHEKICIYGDYDADGVTSTALMFLYLKEKKADVFYYIPSREKDGYGLNVQVIDYLKSQGTKLIFTVDNGISAFNEISYANSIGLDVVVTDHHRVPENLPPAVALVDMFREGCNLKEKNFAGVGIAFKVVEAMEQNKLDMDKYIDLIIPRGGNNLVKFIKENTKIPVLGHADGICHIFVDASADLEKAKRVIIDAKTQYPSACNSVETILIHKDFKYETELLKALEDADIELIATPESWHKEYSDKVLSYKFVSSLEEAIEHINEFSSGHTESILTEDENNAKIFMNAVDSAGVYHNVSTRFADGFRYGFGAEVGISTNKTHARGPVGLEGLTIYKYNLEGNGDIVKDYVEGVKKFNHKDI